MKIKMLTSCSGNDYSFRIGETVDAKDEIAADLIDAGFAEEVKLQTQSKPKETSKSEPKPQTAAKQKAGAKKDAAT